MISIKLIAVAVACLFTVAKASPTASPLGLSDKKSAAPYAHSQSIKQKSHRGAKEIIDIEISIKVDSINQKISEKKLPDALIEIDMLIPEVWKKLMENERPKLLQLFEALYDVKIRILSKKKRYYDALVEGARLRSRCVSSNLKCKKLNRLNKIMQEIEQLLEQSLPGRATGLTAVDMSERQIKNALNRARLILHPDKHQLLEPECREYVNSLYLQVTAPYERLLKLKSK